MDKATESAPESGVPCKLLSSELLLSKPSIFFVVEQRAVPTRRASGHVPLDAAEGIQMVRILAAQLLFQI